MKLRSVRFKISVLYTAVLGVILFVYSILLYFNLSYVVNHEIDRNLKKKVQEIESIINAYSDRFEREQEHTPISLKRTLHLEESERDEFLQWPSIKRLDEAWKYKIQALGIKQDYIVIYYPTGEIVEKSNNLDEPTQALLQKGLKNTPKDKTYIKNFLSKDVHLRIISRPFYRWGRVKYIIQLATSLEPVMFVLRSKIFLILVSIPVFLVFTSFLGRFFVIRTFEPISEIAQTARAISHKDMTKRVELQHADEEIKILVEGFNDMIARLEKSFRYIEEFSSNVAHELKTPLAIIRGELELALRKERPVEEYKKAMGVVLEEAQRMLKTIEDLLLLAKLDYRPEMFSLEPFDFNEFLDEIYEQSKMLASAKNIEVKMEKFPQALRVNGTKLHLRRLFFNLIDNALKYTSDGGRIEIRIERHDRYVGVSVADSGCGIRQEDLPKIFDRFYRVDRAEDSFVAAAGLGLSIVQSIAKIHKGGVDVKSQPGHGTTFIVKLPLA